MYTKETYAVYLPGICNIHGVYICIPLVYHMSSRCITGVSPLYTPVVLLLYK